VVVGAPLATVSGNFREGAAYVFVKPASGWTNLTQTAKLTASDGAGEFGNAVAISGSTVVVGAPLTTFGTSFNKGSVYVFVKPQTGWSDMTQTAELTFSTEGQNSSAFFGSSVAVSGDTAVASTTDGVTYVFVKPASGWADMTETAALGNLAVGTGDVAISGDTVVAGVDGCCIDGQTFQGEAHVFVKPASGWASTNNPNAVLKGSDEGVNDFFGQAVAISGNTIAVGSPFAQSNQGEAYVYVKPAKGWKNMKETAALKAAEGSGFLGMSVATTGKVVVAGAPADLPGSAFVFVKPATGWKSTSHFAAKLTAPNSGSATFNQNVGASGNTLVVGGPVTSVGGKLQGAAFVFGPQ
jgi:hypothetical protein